MIPWLRGLLPTPGLVLVVGPAAVISTLLLAWIAGHLHARHDVRTAYTRKVFHSGIFTLAAVAQITHGLDAVVVYGCGVTLVVVLAVARGRGSAFYEALARPGDRPHGALFVLMPLLTTALGGLLTNLLFASMAPLGYLVVGWGDAAGEVVGTRWGRHRFDVLSLAGVRASRSIEGSLAVLGFSAAAALLALRLAGHATVAALPVALACGVAAAVIEAISSHGLDNLTVQVLAAGVAYALLR